ncbi:MAG: sulfite exporter TauE/SafE family protein [Pseudomonadota bacterium]|uniref:sulfite exporter TauE/SafE family protein n=1 Tax=Pseudooceanicola nitratireducens TaxID=517719 RepID=UPI002E9A1740|nr:sulfite exporter TauE/SafE family protein [Pseudomonadota bacterium]MEC9103421.1 sulfite exporter TauE/SafE family protein [Pseudomonadota bacterium]
MIETFASLLPQGLSMLAASVLIVTSFAASFITVAFGIGGGAVMLTVMATLVPPAALIATHGVIQLGSNLGRAAMTFGHIHWPAIPAFAAGSLIGAGLGGAVVVNLPPAWVQIGVGAFVIWSVLAKPPRIVRDWPLMIGAISSFLTMFFGATGLFVATFTKSQGLARHAYVATHATLMTVQHGIKTLAFGVLGFAFADWGPLIVALILAGLAGTFVGKSVLNRIDDRRFAWALNAILILLSVRLIYAGLRALTGQA